MVQYFQNSEGEHEKIHNTHVILDSEGMVQATYSKVHMFDLDIPGKIRLCESDYTVPGCRITPPVESPVGKVGLGIASIFRSYFLNT